VNLDRSLIALLFVPLFCGSTTVWAQSTDRAALIREIDSLRSELKSREDAFLEPGVEDRFSFAELLGQKDTALVRLLPREEYDQKNRLTIRGGGAFYSFAKLTHEYGYGSDIFLERGILTVASAGAGYGMLANLGDIPLASITLDTPSVRVLVLHTPASSVSKARVEQHRTGEGVLIEDLLYKRYMPAVVDSTYILRSIDYSHSDVLVAFRVVRKDADGSLIIAWKMLKKFDVPEAERDDIKEMK
jgi:hypothetical protein